MKFSLLLFYILIFCSSVLFSQETSIDAYKIEVQGYFTRSEITTKGIVTTNNDESKLFLIRNQEIIELLNSPGCGRYFTVSHDKTQIGFKLIKPDGKQVPAIYDLTSMKVKELTNSNDLCGQVSFSNQGEIAYTIGNDIYIQDHSIINKFSIGTYSNITPISPDGNSAIYNDNNDQLFVINITNSATQQITDNSMGYAFPQWSPDGTKILYSSLSGLLKVYNKATQLTYSLGSGINATWSTDSKYVYFNVISNENLELKGSEIFVSRFDGTLKNQLTNTPEIHEMFPRVGANNEIIFSNYNQQEIIKAFISMGKNSIYNQQKLIKNATSSLFAKSNTGFNSQKNTKAIVMVQGDVPYVNQVYDTPDWHYGYGSCAPSTAIMAIAYYNRVPYWDITCSSPSSHTSHYGSYVADKYRFNEIYYSTVDPTGGGEDAWGGYGYMWGNGSPSSYMAQYIQNHNVNSVKSESTTFQNVIDAINQSYTFPICNLLSSAGHLTLTVGYVVGQHTLIFNDPYGNKNLASWPNFYGKNSYYDWPGYNNSYENLNTIAWTVTAQSSEINYNDTIIDDEYYNHGFYIYNQNLALMRYYRDSKTGGYNNHYWWTYTSASTTTDTCYVTWTPNIPTTGNYEVFAYIPSTGATATAARYKIFYSGGNTTSIINQASHPGQWVSLGIFAFTSGSSGYVRLGDAAGYQSQQIAFDAIRWSFVPDVVANFTSGNHLICSGDMVAFTNSSEHANSFLWLLPGSDLGTSTQTNPTAIYNTPGTYDVTLIAYGAGVTDTISMPDYVTVNANPQADFSSSTTTIQLPNAIVLFHNNSLNATAYFWNFGDGTTSTDQDPFHIYSTAGDYSIMLVASNGLCPNDTITIQNFITVLNAAGIYSMLNSVVSITTHGNILTINPEKKSIENVKIEIINELGQICWSQHIGSISEIKYISLPNISGMNIVRLLSNNEIVAKLKWVGVK